MLRLVNSTFTINTDEYYPVLRQFRRLALGHCWRRELCQLTKTANFKAAPMKKHFWQFITCLLVMQARSLFFSWQIKISNLLHVGLILIISKVFTILCLLCLCRNKEFSGNFQNKTVISKLFFQMSAQAKWEGMPFWSEQQA